MVGEGELGRNREEEQKTLCKSMLIVERDGEKKIERGDDNYQ